MKTGVAEGGLLWSLVGFCGELLGSSGEWLSGRDWLSGLKRWAVSCGIGASLSLLHQLMDWIQVKESGDFYLVESIPKYKPVILGGT